MHLTCSSLAFGSCLFYFNKSLKSCNPVIQKKPLIVIHLLLCLFRDVELLEEAAEKLAGGVHKHLALEDLPITQLTGVMIAVIVDESPR